MQLHSSLSDRARLRLQKKKKRKEIIGQAWWLTSVIPAFREAEVDGSLEVSSDSTSLANIVKPLSLLLKIQKLAGHGGGCLLSQLLGRLRQRTA